MWLDRFRTAIGNVHEVRQDVVEAARQAQDSWNELLDIWDEVQSQECSDLEIEPEREPDQELQEELREELDQRLGTEKSPIAISDSES